MMSLFFILSAISILGLASKHLDFDSRFLRRANEAVLPFYVLHQTVIVVIAFQLIGWNVGVSARFPALVMASLSVILAVYSWAVRPWNVMRFLFGLRPV
jgi:glucans biosynthesis protein C